MSTDSITIFEKHRQHARRASAGIPDEAMLGQFIPLQYHYNMLQDEDRVNAFLAAIEVCVRPGMHVVELGGGTGILSSFAARLGARVTCIERIPELAACARQLIDINGLSHSIEVILADAVDFIPDRSVDIVICEMLHVGLLREKQAKVITAFKENYVNKFGTQLPRFLPEASILMVQPIEQSFDFSGYWAPVPLFQAPLLAQPRTIELAALSPYANISYDDAIPPRFNVLQTIELNNSGLCNAIRFVTQNVIAIDEQRQQAVTWPNQCLVLPTESAIEVSKGRSLEISFAYTAGGSLDQLMQSLSVRLAANNELAH